MNTHNFEHMKPGTKIEYIGGQDPAGQSIYKLEENTTYTVGEICDGDFNGVWHKCVYLVEVGKKCAFLLDMFQEVKESSSVPAETL